MRKRRLIPCPLETRSILWEGANILKLVRELQDFLKTRMKQVSDPTFGTCWICSVCDWSKDYKLYTLLFMSEKRGGNWVTLLGDMHFDKSFGLEPGLHRNSPGRLPG